ncbi:MAG: type I DNA topoisomerase, partial [Planctomycetes bacterium]|nr:type I DNA topoisomerase [Planctomycetota bacterium]
FHEITSSAIKESLEHITAIDVSKVDSGKARRVLDRLVGYKISPLLWKKVRKGLSAGRVQTVALKIVVDREKEIQAFVPEEYYLVLGKFSTQNNEEFSSQLKEFKGKKITKFPKDEVFDIKTDIEKQNFVVKSITTREEKRNAPPPFITSSLQQQAHSIFRFSAQRTMRIAQQLYEGVNVGDELTGLITYMRTDSNHLSAESLTAVRKHIEFNIGKEYIPEKPNFYSSGKNAQQAHEAIRPTDPDLTPNDIKQYLNDDQYKLYNLIWKRFVACQMTPAKWNTTTIEIQADTDVGNCTYKAGGRVLVFDGFTKIWQNNTKDQHLPEVSVNQELGAVDIAAEQHFTKPPARFTEASLVKALEKEGIGRPSTYASIISTIQARKYVEKMENKFYSTDLGEVVTDKLSGHFPRILDIAFTRQMELQLDEIEEGKLNWVSVLNDFYGPFSENLEKAAEEMKHAKAETTPSEYTCPQCNAPLDYRFGKNGRFLSCSTFGKSGSECKYACPCDRDGKMVEAKESEHKCPK